MKSGREATPGIGASYYRRKIDTRDRRGFHPDAVGRKAMIPGIRARKLFRKSDTGSGEFRGEFGGVSRYRSPTLPTENQYPV